MAADLTADVFLAAIETVSRYRAARGAPRAWLFGIACNVVSGERRRAAREQRAFAAIDGRRLLAEDDLERLQNVSTRPAKPGRSTARCGASRGDEPVGLTSSRLHVACWPDDLQRI